MRLSEYFKEHPVTEEQIALRKLARETPPQKLGTLEKKEFSYTLNELPDSAKKALHEDGILWLKVEGKLREAEVFMLADGRIFTSPNILLREEGSFRFRVTKDDVTADHQQQMWAKVYEILFKGGAR